MVQTVDILKQLRLLSYGEVEHVGNVLEQYRQAALKSDGMQMRQNLTFLDGWLASVQVVDLLPQHPYTSKAKPGSLQEKFSQLLLAFDAVLSLDIRKEAYEDVTAKEQLDKARVSFSGLYNSLEAAVQTQSGLRSKNSAVVNNIGDFLSSYELLSTHDQECENASRVMIEHAVEQTVAESQLEMAALGVYARSEKDFTTVCENFFAVVRRFARILVNHLERPEKDGGGDLAILLR